MSFVSVILLSVFGIVCCSNYIHDKKDVERSLEMALRLKDKDFSISFGNSRNFNGNSFVIYTDSNYEYMITSRSVWNIYAEDAQSLIESVKNKDDIGILKRQGFAYKKEKITNYQGYAVAFVDVSHMQSSFQRMLIISIQIGSSVLLVFFILSCILSKWALKPVEQAWDKQKQFVADASHELKTPLTVILADSDVLTNHSTETISSQKQWIESIQSEANRMRKLVEDMLFLAKNDANRIEISMQNCSLSDICFHCVLPFESIAFEKGIDLIDEVEENIEVHGNESQLRQLILIFLDNAIKYTPSGGKIYFKLCKIQNKPVITIRNTDSYIPPEDLKHVFERFYRVDKSRKYQGGAGLGLSIASQIAQSHKIKLSVTSDEKQGTEFTLNF